MTTTMSSVPITTTSSPILDAPIGSRQRRREMTRAALRLDHHLPPDDISDLILSSATRVIDLRHSEGSGIVTPYTASSFHPSPAMTPSGKETARLVVRSSAYDLTNDQDRALAFALGERIKDLLRHRGAATAGSIKPAGDFLNVEGAYRRIRLKRSPFSFSRGDALTPCSPMVNTETRSPSYFDHFPPSSTVHPYHSTAFNQIGSPLVLVEAVNLDEDSADDEQECILSEPSKSSELATRSGDRSPSFFQYSPVIHHPFPSPPLLQQTFPSQDSLDSEAPLHDPFSSVSISSMRKSIAGDRKVGDNRVPNSGPPCKRNEADNLDVPKPRKRTSLGRSDTF